ncbi:MAG: Lrp/AsnC family transcriptional regulator [Sulfurovum sp.]|nr:Lrp/AsnC family transcriptional regulator [Sulfurovum sp.]MCB4750335.1 Lrp/AsnC family transcriptional regulator [Sulfurovum sp.]MCB4751801.1 Lrp/AsnC family transcriptional regulator [Sulfurovum sp.]MCB4761010.1 Lrp/AsnC family transcriptional regulator [Sulfurovum sp.]MCB4772749.1 Lrp/AsnC family transcriptional regulator [Sulfurovum sp.]
MIETENKLLYEMQHAFPITQRPFLELSQKLGITENEILATVRRLKERKIIRQTSAIFDTKRLGYKSSLVAFKVVENKIEQAAKMINAHPGVSHNYLRNHDYNIWFTIAVTPDSKLGLEKTIEILKNKTGAEDAIILPTLKMFKIKVQMDTTGKRAKKEKLQKLAHKEIGLTARHMAIIKALQQDIDVVSEPFKKYLKKLNLSYDEFFTIANELKESGVMRRFATILNHRKAGFSANAMSVWSVPEEKGEEIGKQLAEFSAVSHCYLRPKYPNWPYNLFAMVHAKTQEECDTLIEEMAKESGLTEYGKLYSTVEFKKQRLVYFDDAFKEWEEEAIK